MLMDRPSEGGTAYLDEKQNPISFPVCFPICMRTSVCVCEISLYRDSLMAAGMVNRRSRCLPPLTSSTAVQSVGSTLTKSRTHILTQSLTLITAGWRSSVRHTHLLCFCHVPISPAREYLPLLLNYCVQSHFI